MVDQPGPARRWCSPAASPCITLLVGGLLLPHGPGGPRRAAPPTAWIVIGGALLIVAVGAPLLAWWRLSRVRRTPPSWSARSGA